ncbi:hypothetical protein HWV62_7866 [Athelia sp. TMB]|nr:hypothetical protein HWV62_7866 [Athelia sp. TMB]
MLPATASTPQVNELLSIATNLKQANPDAVPMVGRKTEFAEVSIKLKAPVTTRSMPRILTRLQRQIETSSSSAKRVWPSPKPFPRKKKLSCVEPALPNPSFSAAGRTQSILVDNVNPIVDSNAYASHKSSAPVVAVRRRVPYPTTSDVDRPRVMTAQERRWWASPYLRMLSSPCRTCIVSNRTLPSDFLVRLAPMRMPTPRTAREAQSLLPDGVEHPKFKSRRSYTGLHIICCHTAIDQLAERGNYRRFAPNLSLHSRLKEQIGHILRVRALQELELLANSLQIHPRDAGSTTLVRKLTRSEWHAIRSTGVIPQENALAVVVVPPLNRNPLNRMRSQPSTTADAPAKISSANEILSKKRPAPPLSVLHPAEEPAAHRAILPDRLPSSKVPLYNGVSLFPSQPQRAALHASLNSLLSIERRARFREHGRPDQTIKDTKEDRWARGDQKASHAFLLCADEKTIKRADMAAVAIALWRVRMWEGAGWEDQSDESDGWQLD